MDAMITWTDASFKELGAIESFQLDMEIDITPDAQEQSNDFVLALPIGIKPEANAAVFLEGTQWGGIVHGRVSDTDVADLIEWRGRTWWGVWADRVLVPDAGQERNVSSGTASECIADLIARLGLGDLFQVGECPTALISYTHKRYPTGLDALYDMLASSDLKPVFESIQDGGLKVLVNASAISTATEQVDGESVSMAMYKAFNVYNHIIALGEDEGTARVVKHLYADSSGNISETQTITGLAERTYKYDYPSAEAADLEESAYEKLKDFQGEGEVSVTLPDGSGINLGDYVQAYEPRVDESVTARVTRCVVKAGNGFESCAWGAE